MPAILKNTKLLSLSAAARARARLRRQGRKVVLTNGVFDLLHPGHLYFLEKAARLGDLYVALNGDRSVRQLKGPTRPILGEKQRAYALGQLPGVKAIVIFNTVRLAGEILRLKPDVYVKAGDYDIGRLDPGELAALRAVGAKIRFLPFLKGFSTTGLIARIRAAGEI